MDTELAYLAGFIDGEGCIGTVPMRGYGKRAHNTTPRQQIRISATNASRIPLDMLATTFGGTVTSHHRPMPNRKTIWRWIAASRRASNAIATLLPYLRVKRAQAELCLQLQDLIGGDALVRTAEIIKGRHRFTNIEVRPEVETARRDIVNQLRLLNKRGT